MNKLHYSYLLIPFLSTPLLTSENNSFFMEFDYDDIEPSQMLKIKNILETKHNTPQDVRDLLGFCFETEAFEYVRDIAKKNEEKAANKLQSLKPSYARNMLSAMNERAYNRIANLCI